MNKSMSKSLGMKRPVGRALEAAGEQWDAFVAQTLTPLAELELRQLGGPIPGPVMQQPSMEEDQSAMLLSNLTQILSSLRSRAGMEEAEEEGEEGEEGARMSMDQQLAALMAGLVSGGGLGEDEEDDEDEEDPEVD